MTDTPTPQQQLDTMAAALRGPEPSATPSTPQEAQALLNHRIADKAWGERLLKGDAATVKEYKALTEQVASGNQLAFEHEVVDNVSDPHAMTRGRYDGLLGGLRETQTIDAEGEQYLRDLDAGVRTDRPTAGDKEACQRALQWVLDDLAAAKPDSREARELHVLRGRLANIVAIAADDGRPASKEVLDQLAELDLR